MPPLLREDYMCARRNALSFLAACAASCGKDSTTTAPTTSTGTGLSFFVTSARSTTGNIGGLRGADALCQNLAQAAGAGTRSWRAYLSVERDPDNCNQPTH